TDRLDFRRFMARSFLRYTNGNMRPWPRPGAFPFLQAVHCSDPAPALYAHTLVSVVSHLAMSNDALPVQQENGRRAAYAIGSERLPEGIDGHPIEERFLPAFQELADRILVFVTDRQDGQAPALGKGHHLGHRLLAGAAPCGPEEQNAGAPLEIR